MRENSQSSFSTHANRARASILTNVRINVLPALLAGSRCVMIVVALCRFHMCDCWLLFALVYSHLTNKLNIKIVRDSVRVSVSRARFTFFSVCNSMCFPFELKTLLFHVYAKCAVFLNYKHIKYYSTIQHFTRIKENHQIDSEIIANG